MRSEYTVRVFWQNMQVAQVEAASPEAAVMTVAHPAIFSQGEFPDLEKLHELQENETLEYFSRTRRLLFKFSRNRG